MKPTSNVAARAMAAHDAAQTLAEHENSVRAVISGRVPPSEVDDLVQETLARAVAHLDRLDPSREGAWLTTVAINLTRDWHRRQQREPVASDPEGFDHLAAGAEVETIVTTRVEVQRALDSLPPTQRDVLVRHHVLGFSRREIAEQTGLTLEAVNSLHARAKRSFAAAIERFRALVALPVTPAVERLRRLQSLWLSGGHETASQLVMALIIVGASVAPTPASKGASSAASAASTALASTRTDDAVKGLEESEQPTRAGGDTSGLGPSTVEVQPAAGRQAPQREVVTVEHPIDNPVEPDGNRGRTRVYIDGDPNDSVVLSRALPIVDAACGSTSPQTCDDVAS